MTYPKRAVSALILAVVAGGAVAVAAPAFADDSAARVPAGPAGSGDDPGILGTALDLLTGTPPEISPGAGGLTVHAG